MLKTLKKILTATLALVLVLLIGASGYLFLRYNKNKEQIVPYPYVFENAEAWTISAPIIMIGDRMGEQMARFQIELAAKISENLSKPIEIQSLAK
jgi:hypothetical protein